MWRNMCFILLMFFSDSASKKKANTGISKSAKDLLNKEERRLTKEKIECSIKSLSIKTLDSLRAISENDKLIACSIKYLTDKPDSGWVWSNLGHAYQLIDKTNHAITCFKQTAKLTGKICPHVKEWHFIGPFVIGKTEVDGDPIEAFGGIRNVSKQRYKKDFVLYSELTKSGVVRWSTYKQSTQDELIKIDPGLNWNELVNALGSMAIMEWQGWVVGEFSVNEDNLNINIQCLGVHTVYIDGLVPVTGDVYHRPDYWHSINLAKGIHGIFIQLRTTAVQAFRCSLRVSVDSVEISKPRFLPDLYQGHLFGLYIALPVSNLHATKWLKITKCAILEQKHTDALTLHLEPVSIAPGQTLPAVLTLDSNREIISQTCEDIYLKVKLWTSAGQEVYPLTLRCRKSGESFLFTFMDHDGSVQHAAAIEPTKGCDGEVCAVLLTLHGTTVPPQNQADSYKRMVKGKFVFGYENMWVLAPTRHGAHNWEGPGSLTAMTALSRLEEMTKTKYWIKYTSSSQHVIFAGHSMGGHGAWHLACHHPDRALAVISLAGWIKKEEYGDSNLFFKHDISTSHVDPAIKQVMEACIAENDVDRHISNIQHLPVLARIGALDKTVHPFFVRRMYRLLKEWKVDVKYSEIHNKEHWWWDTSETNDGGAVHDKQIRDFTKKHSTLKSAKCSPDTKESCENSGGDLKYSKRLNQQRFTLTVMNPALGEGLHGVKVLQQIVPFRKSLVKGKVTESMVEIETENVRRFDIEKLPDIAWKHQDIQVDGKTFSSAEMKGVFGKDHLCKIDINHWSLCDGMDGERSPVNFGPVRRVAENKFLIIQGTGGSISIQNALQEFAVYMANLFFLTSDTLARVIKDTETSDIHIDEFNLILVGGPNENVQTSHFIDKVPINTGIQLGQCNFTEAHSGALFIAPHGESRLALVLMGNSLEGLRDVVSLASPTIPPMTRSPFSNLIPDFIITGPEFGVYGPGGYRCAGFWGNKWELKSNLVSCPCVW